MTKPLRIGLLRLSDSAPVMIAHNAGLFAQYGLQTELVISPSWANIADGLVWNTLDAAIMFAPLAMMTVLGRRGYASCLSPLTTLSRGGNTIILRGTNPFSGEWPKGIKGKEVFEHWRKTIGRRPKFSVVHMYSTHLLILRRFLLELGVDMEHDIEIQVMPPSDIIGALADGSIDGGCVGPPWGAEACLRGLAFLAGGSGTVMPFHIEKQIVVSKSLIENTLHIRAIKLALRDATTFLQTAHNQQGIAHELAAPLNQHGLALPEEATLETLTSEGFPERPQYLCGLSDDRDIAWILDDMKELNWIDHSEHSFLKNNWICRI
ncbi:MAG: CmpA/NrtA family ABC transporter substrate-binding protein [Acetobacter sp.]